MESLYLFLLTECGFFVLCYSVYGDFKRRYWESVEYWTEKEIKIFKLVVIAIWGMSIILGSVLFFVLRGNFPQRVGTILGVIFFSTLFGSCIFNIIVAMYAIKMKPKYLKKVVHLIVEQNPDRTEEELVNICKKNAAFQKRKKAYSTEEIFVECKNAKTK